MGYADQTFFSFFPFSLQFLFLGVAHFFSFLQSFFLTYFLSFHPVLSHALAIKRRKAAKKRHFFSLVSLSHNVLSVSNLFSIVRV